MDKLHTEYYPPNTIGRDFVIGDLHGCYEELFTLLELVDFDSDRDRVFSVGDLIDRGPKSLMCLHLLDQPWFAATKGNHELMMEESINNPTARKHWYANGGSWASELSDDQLQELVNKYIKPMPVVIVIGKDTPERVNIVHAELLGRADDHQLIVYSDQQIDDGLPPSAQLQLTWGRTLVDTSHTIDAPDTSPTICGHTPIRSIAKASQHIFIDTAAVYGRQLTAIELPLTIGTAYQLDIATWTVSEVRL